MIKVLLSIAILILPTSTSVSMLRTPARVRLPRATHQRIIRTPRIATRHYSTKHDEHREAEAKRQEAWLRLKGNVAERIVSMKEQAQKHRDLAANNPKHADYAKTYERLAQLEIHKFELFEHTLNKIATAALYFEEPNMEDEVKLMELLHNTYAELHDTLPKDDKI